MARIRNACPIILAAAALAGCSTLNRSVSPGSEPLPIYRAERDAATPAMIEGPALTRGHDRGHWTPHVVPVPVYRVRHNPAADFRPVGFEDDSPRARGTFPEPRSALDVSGDVGEAAADAVVELAASTWSVVSAPVFMALRHLVQPPPRSPQHEFMMVPRPRTGDRTRWHRVGDAPGNIGLTPEPPDADGEP